MDQKSGNESKADNRHKAFADLKESEQRFGLLVDAVVDYAIYMLDLDGRVINWNRGAQRIKGYTAAEIIGHDFSRFLYAGRRPVCPAAPLRLPRKKAGSKRKVGAYARTAAASGPTS